MEIKMIEPDYDDCEYCVQSYYEYDTGYSEYECRLWYSEGASCLGGSLNNGCPLAFKYKVEEN